MFTTMIEKTNIPYCRLGSSVSVAKVGGGTVKAGLITYTALTYADRTTYLSTLINFNYAITTLADVGTYEVTISFSWEENITFSIENLELTQNFKTYMVVIDKNLVDPCTSLVTPVVPFTRNVYIGILNKPVYIYPTTSINHPECPYELTCTMNFEGSAFQPINYWTGFTGPNTTGWQSGGIYTNCLVSNILANFDGMYDKTKTGVYIVRVNISWASGTRTATYDVTLHLRDPCGIPPSPDRGIKPTLNVNKTWTMLSPTLALAYSAPQLATIYDGFCHFKLTTSVVKAPALPDTRSITLPTWSGTDDIYLVKGSNSYYPYLSYDWSKVGTYTITETLLW
jgi:hypothetical protein